MAILNSKLLVYQRVAILNQQRFHHDLRPPLISAAMATAVPVLRRRTIHGTDGGRSANFQARGHGLDHLYTHFL